MLGERNSNTGTKVSEVMLFIAQIPLMLSAIVITLIYSPLLVVAGWRAAVLLWERYLSQPW